MGTKETSAYGPWSAFSIFTPPETSAGKNLSRESPRSSPCSTWLGELMPGTMGKSLARQASTTRGLKPGLTANWAPAATASSTWERVVTVPAPTRRAGYFSPQDPDGLGGGPGAEGDLGHG